jgi:oligopeptide transport system substrate-binding protein
MSFFKKQGHRLAILVSAACLLGTLGVSVSSTTALATSGPQHGGTLQTAFQSDPTTFDPQVCYDATCWDNMEMIFNRLYDYVTGGTTLQPQAAAAFPVISGGGRIYTIAIRKGMEFSNGRPVTAADFAYTYSRICNPATKSPVVGFWTVVAGCTAYAKSPKGYVSGIKVLSPYSLKITLTQPNSAFVYVMAMPHASVIPTGSGAKQAQHPLGSGPYELVSYTPGQAIVLTKNPHYWKRANST